MSWVGEGEGRAYGEPAVAEDARDVCVQLVLFFGVYGEHGEGVA